MKIRQITKPHRHAGFSLVELMVAIVIGLIGTLVMFQVFAVSEGQKRTTASGGDAQQNGAIGLFTLERELRNSGHGLTKLIAQGQPIYGWNVKTDSPRPAIVLKPVLITPGDGVNGDLGSDLIEINYSNFEGIGTGVPLDTAWDPNTNTIGISNPAAYREGDVLVVCNHLGPGTPPCIQVQISDPLGATTTVNLNPPPDKYTRNGYARESEYNAAGGIGAKLTPSLALEGRTIPAQYLTKDKNTGDDSVVFNLGSGITSHLYRVRNGSLMYFDGGAWQEFADGIVSIRAQYGLDTSVPVDGSVDVWVNPRPADANPLASFTPNHPAFNIASNSDIASSWSRVSAVRLAIVVRSGIKEKTIVETRSTIPLWTNPVGNPAPGPSYTVPSGDGGYYRYKVLETMVPFRNMIWNPQ